MSPLTNLGLYGNFTLCDKDIIQGLNANFQLLDNLVQLAVTGFVTELPDSPDEGDKYILPDGTINLWNGSAWITYPAQEGYIGYNKDDGFIYFYDGTGWRPLPAELIFFDNTGTTITSNNLQGAILELIAMVEGLPVSGIDNVGSGAEVYKDTTSGTANLRTLVAESSAKVTQQTNEILIGSIDNPIGTVIMHVTGVDPSARYLYCDGSEISRVDYSELFGVIGTSFGPGDGLTTFNIPNYQALVPRSTGSQLVNGRTKTGPALTSTQEDQMQRITGSLTINTVFSGDVAGSGALVSTSGANFSNTLPSASNRTRSVINFSSADSPFSRVSATTDGETRVSSFGIAFMIKAKS